ncbi:MAG: glycosyltransferase, partial [Candidatus Symbiothrix sp.]|nr:glycosyltransferase [Candidatus Symbiothrix sp.]
MKRIKIYFEDFWQGFDIESNFIIELLRQEYVVVIDNNPDYLFFSVFDYNHLKYRNCIKIFYSGENIEPDFNLCDYAIAFQHLNAGDRYLRHPLFVISGFEKVENKPIDPDKALNRKFCNFVYSNWKWSDPVRETFFKKLSKYKKVDSGGRYLNNIGSPVTDKIDFIKDYKITIAFENSSQSGYTTEKLIGPMIVNSMPVYWGNPDIHLDFNKESIIFVNDYDTLDAAVDEVIRLDKDDRAYLEKLSKSWYTGQSYAERQLKLLSFLKNIFDQELSKAKRTTDYGYVRIYRQKQETMGQLFKEKIMRISLFDTEF